MTGTHVVRMLAGGGRRARRRRWVRARHRRRTALACAPPRPRRQPAAVRALRHRPTSCRSRWRCRRRRRASRRDHRSASAFAKAIDLVVGVGGGQRDPQPRRSGRRPSAAGWRAPASRGRRAGGRTRRGHGARRRARRGRSATGGPARRVRRGRRSRSTSASPSSERSTRSRSEGGAGVGRCRRGGEDERPGGVDEEVDERSAVRRRNRPGSRASSTACRPVGRSTSALAPSGSGGPSTAWASSSMSKAPRRRARRHERVERRNVAVHREHGVGHDDRGAVVPARAVHRRGRRRRGGRSRPARATAGSRR